MKLKIWFSALMLLVATGLAWRLWGGAVVAAVGGALLLWLLLHYTRVMNVMQRAAQRPIGTVDSAVMLNARLSQGMSLLQILGLTRSLGQGLDDSPNPAPPGNERFVWRDASGAAVTVTLRRGKLQQWALTRNQPDT